MRGGEGGVNLGEAGGCSRPARALVHVAALAAVACMREAQAGVGIQRARGQALAPGRAHGGLDLDQ